MGHMALPILQQLVKNEMVAGIRVKGEPDEVLGCPTCMQAKFTRYQFSSSEATAKVPLDEVVMDVVGPLKLGAAGAEYFLTIVGVYTRMTWVYVLSKKSDVAEMVKTDWLPMVERQQDRKIAIRHSLTMPYSPAMNGIAERANQTITETARGLLIEAGLPDYFWPDLVRSACVAKNRVLTHVRAEKWVPYVEWIGRKPKVDMLQVFGCMCMALVPKHLRHNKLGAKAIWAVHLGVAQYSKGWLLWDPFTKKFLVSRDCKFMENLMYKDWKAENEAKIGVRFGEVKSSGLVHVELPLELSSSTTTTRQSSLVNGGEEANDAEEEEKEVQQPEGFDDGSGRVWKLKKALYGLKQAPRQWYLKVREVLEEIGFTPSSADHSLFILGGGEQRSFMVVYVDHILIFSPSSDLVKEVMLKLQDKFKCKALGDVSFYLGLHIERDVEKRCMRVHQRKYLEALAANFGQSEGHVATRFPSGFKCVKGPEEESVGEEERRRFHSLVGSLMYAAVNTRPDVAFATGQLARFFQCPNEDQVAAGMRVAKYLGQTASVGLQYSTAAQRRQKGMDGVEPERLFLTAFSDASYASEREDMTSVGGFICYVAGAVLLLAGDFHHIVVKVVYGGGGGLEQGVSRGVESGPILHRGALDAEHGDIAFLAGELDVRQETTSVGGGAEQVVKTGNVMHDKGPVLCVNVALLQKSTNLGHQSAVGALGDALLWVHVGEGELVNNPLVTFELGCAVGLPKLELAAGLSLGVAVPNLEDVIRLAPV
ncbi:unnamed protein product [Closterium sp. NIES-54]